MEIERAPLSYAGKRDFAFGPPLADAVESGDQAIVEYLLSKKAPVNEPNRYGKTPLTIAIGLDNPGLVRVLLQGGASANQPDANGTYPLAYARKYNRENKAEIVRLLLAHGARQ